MEEIDILRRYKTIEEWISCNEVFPIGTMLYVKGTDDLYVSDGKNKFNDLVCQGTIDGLEQSVIKYYKL